MSSCFPSGGYEPAVVLTPAWMADSEDRFNDRIAQDVSDPELIWKGSTLRYLARLRPR